MKITTSFFIIFMLGILMSPLNTFAQDTKENKAKTQFIQVNQAKIAYRILGQGDPIILCMGYASNMDLWSTGLLNELQKEYKVIIYDYRGMGLSTNRDSSFTIAALAHDMNQLLTHLNISKTHVLGWSMGGYVAQMFAINYPDKLNKLVLYATDVGDTITVNPDQKTIEILENPKSTPMELLGTLFPDDWMKSHKKPWNYLPQEKEPMNAHTIGLEYEAVAKWLSPGGGSAGHLHTFKSPTLLICGSDDKVVPNINSSILSDSIPNATLIIVNGVGHGFMYQRPETFIKYVKAFLKNQ